MNAIFRHITCGQFFHRSDRFFKSVSISKELGNLAQQGGEKGGADTNLNAVNVNIWTNLKRCIVLALKVSGL